MTKQLSITLNQLERGIIKRRMVHQKILMLKLQEFLLKLLRKLDSPWTNIQFIDCWISTAFKETMEEFEVQASKSMWQSPKLADEARNETCMRFPENNTDQCIPLRSHETSGHEPVRLIPTSHYNAHIIGGFPEYSRGLPNSTELLSFMPNLCNLTLCKYIKPSSSSAKQGPPRHHSRNLESWSYTANV